MPRSAPRYNLTRQAFWASFALAWSLIMLVCWYSITGSEQATALAAIVVPSMVAMIAALLGIHRVAGAMDFRTLTQTRPPDGAPGGEEGT